MKKDNGQSMAGLLVSLAICGIIIAMALPELRSLVERNRQTQATNQLIGALHYARNTAVFERATVSLCPGLEQCTRNRAWHDHLLVFIDRNANGLQDPEDRLLQQLEIPDEYNWYWGGFGRSRFIQYRHTGRSTSFNGTLTLCHKNEPRQQVVINVTGRVRTQAQLRNPRCN